MRQKNYLRNNRPNCSKFDENYKLTDRRQLVGPKHKKPGENYSKANYNQIVQNL